MLRPSRRFTGPMGKSEGNLSTEAGVVAWVRDAPWRVSFAMKRKPLRDLVAPHEPGLRRLGLWPGESDHHEMVLAARRRLAVAVTPAARARARKRLAGTLERLASLTR